MNHHDIEQLNNDVDTLLKLHKLYGSTGTEDINTLTCLRCAFENTIKGNSLLPDLDDIAPLPDEDTQETGYLDMVVDSCSSAGVTYRITVPSEGLAGNATEADVDGVKQLV